MNVIIITLDCGGKASFAIEISDEGINICFRDEKSLKKESQMAHESIMNIQKRLHYQLNFQNKVLEEIVVK